MESTTRLLELRAKIKSRKPEFIRQDYGRRIRINRKWRKPKGIHSKIRHHFKGRRKMPSSGYKSPTAVKGLHESGLKPVRISTPGALKDIKKQDEGIVISKSVGSKKRLEILGKAKELGIIVLNLNSEEHIKKIMAIVDSKKKAKESVKKESEKKKEKPKAEEKKVEESKPQALPEVLSDEEKKEIEKKEKDKLLIKKQ